MYCYSRFKLFKCAMYVFINRLLFVCLLIIGCDIINCDIVQWNDQNY